MATGECSEVGRGPCPCGTGTIIAEKCMADFPWVKPHQFSYRYAVECEPCRDTYAFHGRATNEPSSLVKKADIAALAVADAKWSTAFNAITEHADFVALAKAVQERLAQEKSVTAEFRALSHAGMGARSLESFRKHGYELTPSSVMRAMKFVGTDYPALAALVEQEEVLGEARRRPIPAIATGIDGVAL